MSLPPSPLIAPDAVPARPSMIGALLGHFGSLRSALALMALLGVAVLVGRFHTHWLAPLLTATLALLAACLLVALVVTPALRRQAPLLVFHLALLGLVTAAGLGRMTALEGRFELLEGVDWDGQLLDGAVGAWHPVERLGRLSFRQDGFEIAYAPGLKRGPTQNLVRWRDAAGRPQSARIGDHRPLQLDGYRIYTSPNKGYAPLLRWEPRGGGEAVLGAVHLPSYPANALRQSQEWTLPDGQRLWLKLDFDPLLIDPEQSSRFRLPDSHSLVLWRERERAELQPGEAFELPGGRLVYLGLRSWMGYRIAYDAALPWLLGLALLAVASLAWHYTRRFFGPAPVAALRPAPRAADAGGAVVAEETRGG